MPIVINENSKMKDKFARDLLESFKANPSLTLFQDGFDIVAKTSRYYAPFHEPKEAMNEWLLEVEELCDAIKDCNQIHIRNEIGDVLLCLINISRLHGLNFDNIFNKMAIRWLTRKVLQEDKIEQAGYDWGTIPTEKCKKIWQEVKKELKEEEEK